jgi:6-phospho-beta-glucosidase
MKLAVVGGGGVRSPFLARSLGLAAREIGLDEVVFMDTDPSKLATFGVLSRKVAAQSAPDLGFRLSGGLEEALAGADFIITTMRVGGDAGRAADERAALGLGIIGQETTGAGGFAMAMRTIPAMLEVCETARRVAAPGAVLFNFTNPSGLVTQAMRDSGFDNVYGVCDAPSGLLGQIAALLGRRPEDFEARCFGLNHLSFFKSLRLDGAELLPGLLADDRLYSSTDMRYFPKALAMRKGLLINEYMYYYYYPEQALRNIREGGLTRGERIAEINGRMLEELSGIDIESDPGEALRVFERLHGEREGDYMARESGTRRGGPAFRFDPLASGTDGYAGVALAFAKARNTATADVAGGEMILCLPNSGAIEGLADDDVVEVSCAIGREGALPKSMGAAPPAELELIRRVKAYERLAAKAILTRDRNAAIDALHLNPLVASLSIAESAIDAFLVGGERWIGDWSRGKA